MQCQIMMNPAPSDNTLWPPGATPCFVPFLGLLL